jgi:hypothetical protein
MMTVSLPFGHWILCFHPSPIYIIVLYGHVALGLQEAAAQRFDDAIANSYNETTNEVVH